MTLTRAASNSVFRLVVPEKASDETETSHNPASLTHLAHRACIEGITYAGPTCLAVRRAPNLFGNRETQCWTITCPTHLGSWLIDATPPLLALTGHDVRPGWPPPPF